MRDREDNVWQLERSIRRLEEWVAPGTKAKEEVVDDVVEVEVDEMMEEKVKEEVEEKVVEEKVTAAGEWLGGFMGGRAVGAIMHLAWHTAILAGLHPPNLNHPLLVRLESPISTLRFLMQPVQHKILGQGRWVWADEGGIHHDKPLRVVVVAEA